MSISVEAFEKAGGIFRIKLHEEDMPVRGNVMASGDDAVDRAAEDAILERLDRGEIWAWCCVEVIAYLDGNFTGHDCLGGCSYASEEDFKRDGYYEDMQHEALADLERSLAAAAQHGREAEARLKELTA
jgi:hypothetical protein